MFQNAWTRDDAGQRLRDSPSFLCPGYPSLPVRGPLSGAKDQTISTSSVHKCSFPTLVPALSVYLSIYLPKSRGHYAHHWDQSGHGLGVLARGTSGHEWGGVPWSPPPLPTPLTPPVRKMRKTAKNLNGFGLSSLNNFSLNLRLRRSLISNAFALGRIFLLFSSKRIWLVANPSSMPE